MQLIADENGEKFMIEILKLLKNLQQKNGISNQIPFLLQFKPLFKDVHN
jgi:hypothetical protein